MNKRICTKCKKELLAITEYFTKEKYGKYGLRSVCRDCRKEDKKEYRKNNIEKLKKYQKKYMEKYYKNNAEKLYKIQKIWAKNNPEKLREIFKKAYKKRRLNPTIKLNNSISTLIRHSLKNGKNGYHWEKLVNYTLWDLINHLENKFKDNMSWNNYGKNGWEIDHIVPISLWQFSSYKDNEFKQCWALSNLQPLWAEENRRKYNKIEVR